MVGTTVADDPTVEVTDEELCALALAADPDAPLDDDAVPLSAVTGGEADNGLPSWYMPAVAGGRVLRGWKRIPPVIVIAAFIAINAAGLCNTYGQLGFH
jgi:hypothetical protein